ncbi:MAG: ATP-dependent DNA ligase [Candidatus Bathyarchaeia archaeon]
MNYSNLVNVYESIEATTKRLEMTDYLVQLLKGASADSIDKLVYLTQGKLYPDFMGVEVGVAEKLVIKAISAVSGKPEEEVEQTYKELGDLGKAAESILQRKTQQTLFQRPLTIDIVYDALEKMAKATGSGAVEVKIRHLCSLLNDASPKEAKYIVRTVLGKLRLGIADMTILDALAVAFGGGKEARPLIERAYNLSSDLGLVARTVLEEGLDGVSRFKIRVGNPIRPMLAERLSSAEEILEKLGGKCAAEYKYDGLRIQAHLSGDRVLLFSRRLENITSQFPDVVKILSEHVKRKECVLEGECVAYNPNTGEMLPFQAISQRRGRKYEIDVMEKEVPVKIFLFDLLYEGGEDYTLKVYPERRAALESLVERSDKLDVSHQIIAKTPEELDRYMDQAVSEGCEGLVAKSLGSDSVYQAGARGWVWIKYKRSYKAEIADTFDLVPVGAFKGRGRRAGSYGALLMAAYDKEKDVFETVCKLGSGFTDADLESLPERFKEYVRPERHPRVNSLMEPDVWFSPTLVMEVAADEITLSPLHTCAWGLVKKDTGLALRFPRFTGNYRFDKSPEDSTTTEEMVEIYKTQLKQVS